MSDVQARPANSRGRGTPKRGGFGPRGGARAARTQDAPTSDWADEDNELAQLRKQYSSQLSTLKEMFPNWTDEDIVYALEETNGDLEATIERITEGHTSQWGEVKKKSKDRSRSKAKDSVTPASDLPAVPGSKSARGRGSDATRGGRGRATERGRSRGRGGLSTNGTSHADVKQADISADTQAAGQTHDSSTDDWSIVSKPDQEVKGWADDEPPAEPAKQTSVIPEGTKKSWASIFAKPVVPQTLHKVLPNSVADKIEHKVEQHVQKKAEKQEQKEESTGPTEAPVDVPTVVVEESLPPPKDELTEHNLEKLPDSSGPVLTETEISNAALSNRGTSTPNSVIPPAGTPSRVASSGYAATAARAAIAGRSSSFQRRVWDQQESVVMPDNKAVNSTAVQFGSLALNGSADDVDVDEEREEPETRAQPPQHSPVSHPVAALPPAPQTRPGQDSSASPAARHAPGLPPPAAVQTQPSGTTPIGTQAQPIQTSQEPFNQFNRTQQPEQAAPAPKPYEPFGQPAQQAPSQAQNSPYGGYHGQQVQQALGQSLSSAPSDFSSYYSADNRLGNMHYYGGPYGQHTSQQTDTQQRNPAAISGSPSEQATSAATQSRYGQDSQNSGHSTPNPSAQPPQSGLQQSQLHHQGQNMGQYAGYPYYHPSVYAAYFGQQGYPNYNPAYGSQYGGKHNMYGQPHQYGISPQASFEQSTSPANAGAFGQPTAGREQGQSASDYGRFTQGQHPGSGPGAYGSTESFGRPGQNYGQQNGEEVLKSYDGSKTNAGSNANLNRPNSAANQSGPGSQQPGGPQSQQSYGSFGNHYNQQAGQGFGVGQGQGGQSTNSGYNSYGNSFGSGFYGGGGNSNNQRGGWGQGYGH